jgi:hypothetical protein
MGYHLSKSMMIQKRFWVVAVVATLIMTALAGAVQAGEPDTEGGWEFAIVPYMWALGLDGDVTVRGQKSDVDASFGDIWDVLNFAAMAEFDARKGRFGFFLNPMYAALEADNTVSGVKVEADMDMFIGSFGGYYQLGPYPLTDTAGSGKPAVTIKPLIGGRYTDLETTLDFKGIAKLRGSQDWLDPIVGVRTIWVLSERWSFGAAGNLGGFGLGSDFAWEAWGLFAYRFSLFGEDNAQFLFGYRTLYQDYEDGHGARKFEYDATMHGPLVGLSIGF